ncbi:MAG: CvpA family protein [Herbinix sp.]|nr:CvpA family protein [Herbinix sp.]
MNWLLIVVLAILVVNSLIGMKVGMIKTIFSLFSMVIALGLTIWISPHVNDFMRGNDKLCNYISTKVEKVLPLIEEKADKNDQVSLIEGLSLPQSLKNSLIENNNAEVYKELSVNGFNGYISSYLMGIIINALAFSVTFITILILLWVISIALDIISMLPLLKQINKTAGLLAGLVHGLVVVWLFFIVLTVFQSSELGQKAMAMISEDQILSLIYNNNFLLGFITSAAKMFL